MRAQRPPLPAVAREVRDAGHEIGNHSDTHPLLALKSPEFIYREMALAQETIHLNTGATPQYFRAPYGVRWFGLRRAQRRLGLTGVMWTVIGHDWKWPSGRIARRMTAGARNGGILCLHDGRTTKAAPDVRPTLDAVEFAIPMLIDRGFQFQTVSEMLCPKPELTRPPRESDRRSSHRSDRPDAEDPRGFDRSGPDFEELKIDSLDGINHPVRDGKRIRTSRFRMKRPSRSAPCARWPRESKSCWRRKAHESTGATS